MKSEVIHCDFHNENWYAIKKSIFNKVEGIGCPKKF